MRYELKTPYRDGTTLVIFEPLDIMYRTYGMPRAQEALEGPSPSWQSLVPKPRVNLTRFLGVFAPNSKHRVQLTPAKRDKGHKGKLPDEPQDQSQFEKRASMTGFCSCKTGIHAILGNVLGATPEAGFQYRHRDLQ